MRTPQCFKVTECLSTQEDSTVLRWSCLTIRSPRKEADEVLGGPEVRLSYVLSELDSQELLGVQMLWFFGISSLAGLCTLGRMQVIIRAGLMKRQLRYWGLQNTVYSIVVSFSFGYIFFLFS